MGCQACRQSEPETTFLFNDGEIKNLDNQIQSNPGKKDDYNNFILKFICKFENKIIIVILFSRMTIIILFSNLQINYQI